MEKVLCTIELSSATLPWDGKMVKSSIATKTVGMKINYQKWREQFSYLEEMAMKWIETKQMQPEPPLLGLFLNSHLKRNGNEILQVSY